VIDRESLPRLLTTGELARVLEVPLHRLQYVLQRDGIQPIGLAGSAYIYDAIIVAFLRATLARDTWLQSVKDKAQSGGGAHGQF